jgi:hypothetical protein
MTSRINDPFAEIEAGWERWSGPQHDAEFSQPDVTPRSLKEWLRSDEVQKAIAASQLQPPAPRERGWSMASIPTFQAKHLAD